MVIHAYYEGSDIEEKIDSPRYYLHKHFTVNINIISFKLEINKLVNMHYLQETKNQLLYICLFLS